MIRLHTNKHLPAHKREMESVAFSFLFLSFIWLNARYVSIYPPTITDTITVFDVYESQRVTFILTFGHGKRAFIGQYNFTVGHTYEAIWTYSCMLFSKSRAGIKVKAISMRDLNGTQEAF